MWCFEVYNIQRKSICIKFYQKNSYAPLLVRELHPYICTYFLLHWGSGEKCPHTLVASEELSLALVVSVISSNFGGLGEICPHTLVANGELSLYIMLCVISSYFGGQWRNSPLHRLPVYSTLHWWSLSMVSSHFGQQWRNAPLHWLLLSFTWGPV